MTPTWQRGDVQLYLGDCREILPNLPKVDAVVTDPPYGIGFSGKATKHTPASGIGYIGVDDAEAGPMMISKLIGLGMRAVVFSGNANAFAYPIPREIGGIFTPSGAGLGRWGFTCFHVALFYGSPRHGCTRPTAIVSNERILDDIEHPCPKPLSWMRWAIEIASERDETILDPFMGSGTTGVAAAKLGRKFIGIEIEPKYFDIAVKRISEAQDQFELFDPVPPAMKQAELFSKEQKD